IVFKIIALYMRWICWITQSQQKNLNLYSWILPHSPSQYPHLLASCPDFLCRLSFPCFPSLFCSHLGLALCLCLQLMDFAHHLSNYILLSLLLSLLLQGPLEAVVCYFCSAQAISLNGSLK